MPVWDELHMILDFTWVSLGVFLPSASPVITCKTQSPTKVAQGASPLLRNFPTKLPQMHSEAHTSPPTEV